MNKQKKKPSIEWVSGHINWFDPDSGKGSIIGDDGIWYRIHEFSEIQTKKNKLLKTKTRVEFQLAQDSVNPIIKSVRETDEAHVVEQPVLTRQPGKMRSI